MGERDIFPNAKEISHEIIHKNARAQSSDGKGALEN